MAIQTVADIEVRPTAPRLSLRIRVLVAFVCLSVGGAATYLLHNTKATEPPDSKTPAAVETAAIPIHQTPNVQTPFKQPASLEELLAVQTANLGKVDLALMNLLCAEGLPGSEGLSISQYLATLDEWTGKIKMNIDHYYEDFLRDPQRSHTVAEYRMMMIMNVLGPKGYGIHYDETLATAEYGADPAKEKSISGTPTGKLGADSYAQSDLYFINGLLGSKHSGTCSSLPILVAVVAQRLGYPVTLVTAFRHMFVRWDDGKERFNIETTVTGGLQVVSDYEYRQWPKPLTGEMIAAEGYLQSQSPAQLLANFLYDRIACLLANGQTKEAEKLRQKCLELVPSSIKYRKLPDLSNP